MADTLFLNKSAGGPGDLITADVKLLNERRIVGMQFDLKIPAGQAIPGGAFLSGNAAAHRVSSRVVADKLKVVVHSPTNAELPSAEVLSVPLTLAPTSPAGGPAFTVENLVFTNAAGQAISGAVFYHPLEVWRQERFTQEQRENPEIIGDFKDPDGDGFTNIMEFLFATDPLAPDEETTVSQGLRRRLIPVPGGDPIPGPMVFTFDFPRVKGADGVNLWIETSTDLRAWTREAIEPVQAGTVDSVTDRMRLAIETDPSQTKRRFFRIGVERSEDPVLQPGFVPKVSFDEWLTRSFFGDDLTDPGKSGEQADPDGDGMVNLMEYYFGSDPINASTTPLPRVGLVVDEGIKTAVLTYGLSREAEGVVLTAEASVNLQTWVPVASPGIPTGRASATKVEMAAMLAGMTPDRQFFRFRAGRSFGATVPFAGWQPRYFSGADLADAAVAGAQADPDGDGLVNLMEYFFGSDPKMFSREALPVPGLKTLGLTRKAFLTYDVAKEAEGVVLKIEGSEDLKTWSPRTFEGIPTGATTETKIRISAEIDGEAPGRQFFRFEMEEEP